MGPGEGNRRFRDYKSWALGIVLSLAGVIGLVMGDGVTLVSSADETAKGVYRMLTERGLLRPDDASPPEHRFLATGDPEPFARLASRCLGPELSRPMIGVAG